jgi:hypothetical protein
VLVRIDLTPPSSPPRGNWKETWLQCLEIVRRCIYLDKDLLLPPMGTAGAAETFYVIASTDLQRSGIMITRIREQLERLPDLKSKCTLTISAAPIQLPGTDTKQSLDQQIQSLAGSVTQMIFTGMERKHVPSGKKPKNHN